MNIKFLCCIGRAFNTITVAGNGVTHTAGNGSCDVADGIELFMF